MFTTRLVEVMHYAMIEYAIILWLMMVSTSQMFTHRIKEGFYAIGTLIPHVVRIYFKFCYK